MASSHIRSLQSFHVEHTDTQNEDADPVRFFPLYVNE